MKSSHGSSRRQVYGRRMKDLRTRRGAKIDVDLDGPADWNRGAAWDEENMLHRASSPLDGLEGSDSGRAS